MSHSHSNKPTHNFEKGDRVVVTLPLCPDEGKEVTIVKPTGAGVLRIEGIPFYCAMTYQVNVEGIGAWDGNMPIIYPAEFLEHAEPKVSSLPVTSTWNNFEKTFAELGYPDLANAIKGITPTNS